MGKIKDLFFKQQSSPRVVVYSSPERRPGQYVFERRPTQKVSLTLVSVRPNTLADTHQRSTISQ